MWITNTLPSETDEHTSLLCCSRIADSILLYFTMPIARSFRMLRTSFGTNSVLVLHPFSALFWRVRLGELLVPNTPNIVSPAAVEGGQILNGYIFVQAYSQERVTCSLLFSANTILPRGESLFYAISFFFRALRVCIGFLAIRAHEGRDPGLWLR